MIRFLAVVVYILSRTKKKKKKTVGRYFFNMSETMSLVIMQNGMQIHASCFLITSPTADYGDGNESLHRNDEDFVGCALARANLAPRF